MFAAINGVTLHYQDEGGGSGPALIFINSLGTDLRIWDAVTSSFTGRFRVVRHDKRGHGLSDCPSGPYTIADMAGDLEGLLTHLHIETIIPIGISIGGMIALELAARIPQRTAALVLCDTGAKIGTHETWNQRINTVRERGMEAICEGVLNIWFTPAFAAEHPAERQGYHHMLTRMPASGYAATCEALRDADLTNTAQSIRAPTLVLGGADDVATPPDLMRQLAQLIPGAALALIDGAAHLPCIEKPADMVSTISTFLSEQGYG